MSAHTPGPWAADFGEAYAVTAPDKGRVAICTNLKGAHGMGGRRTGDEVEANARLIAAAPDLLEALEVLVAELGDCRLTEPARAAIAKATKP